MDMSRCERMTEEKAAVIKYLVGGLGWAQANAAAYCHVNQGRVSEVMTGKRFEEILPVRSLPNVST